MNKIMTMQEAVSRFVRRGDTVFLSGMQHGEPSAAVHEIVRQRIDHLTLICCLVITDMGIYEFVDREMTLVSVHTGLGISLDRVRAETGWELRVSPRLEGTAPPTEEELRVLREKVDPKRLFIDGKFAL